VSAQLVDGLVRSCAVRAPLPWSDYGRLLAVRNAHACAFYEGEALCRAGRSASSIAGFSPSMSNVSARFEHHHATDAPDHQGQGALPAGSSPDQLKRSEARRCERSDLCAVG